MTELEKLNIYACALPLPTPSTPKLNEWTAEIIRIVNMNPNDEIYLVGHSLGVPTILRYLESSQGKKIAGVILASGPIEPIHPERPSSSFLRKKLDFEKIKNMAGKFVVIHGDNDEDVPVEHAKKLAKELNCELIIVKNGGHLNGTSGWTALPQALEALKVMFRGEAKL